MSQQYQVPGTPRIISPSPTLSDTNDTISYFPPTTRSASRRTNASSAISEVPTSDEELELRARTRSRSPNGGVRRRRQSGLAPLTPKSPPAAGSSRGAVKKSEPLTLDGKSNGHLSPVSAGTSFWRNISRSPSPLGLIPLHRQWRSFIHRHEIPRKVLHVSIGFFTLHLYTRGIQETSIHPYLLSALIPIAGVEFVRHRSPSFNRIYVKMCGALMRESEVHDKYNGVIFYLLGAWAALRFFPKDIGVMGILLLSWCDTAASTIGRAYGRYTPRIRKGKSLAGSAAAALVGIATAVLWYGYFVPGYFGFEEDMMFKGTLSIPTVAAEVLGYTAGTVPILRGWQAIGIMSLVSGLIASASEAVDLFGWDDNLTIPILSSIGLWGFLKVFG